MDFPEISRQYPENVEKSARETPSQIPEMFETCKKSIQTFKNIPGMLAKMFGTYQSNRSSKVLKGRSRLGFLQLHPGRQIDYSKV